MSQGLLLHTCCAPCATYVVKRLGEEGWQPSLFWYNPNIHPYAEHQQRLECLRRFAQGTGVPLVLAPAYDMVAYFRLVVSHEDKAERCLRCYRLRLSQTAQMAQRQGFAAFSTTLLISPYQKHELLKEVSYEVAREHGLTFFYQDMRPGYRESRRMARELGLYRQRYCGCLYSEWERHIQERSRGTTAVSPKPEVQR